MGIPKIWTIVYWGLYWGTLILGTYHLEWRCGHWRPSPCITGSAVLLMAVAPCKMQPFLVMMVMKRTKACPSCGPIYGHTYLKRSIILYTKNAQSRPPAGTHPKPKPKILAVFSPKTLIPSKHDVLPVGLACPDALNS